MGTDIVSNKGLEKLILLSAFCLTLQGAALIWWADLRGWPAALWTLTPAVAAACFLGSRALRRHCEIAHLAIIVGLGGLAMLVGMWFDGMALDSGMAGSHHTGHGFMGFWNWGTAGMLAVCIPACAWIDGRSNHAEPARGWLRGLGGLVGMLAGMPLGGLWLAGPLTPLLGSMLAAHHLAMVVGMTLGTALGQRGGRLLEAALPARPVVATGRGTLPTHEGG